MARSRRFLIPFAVLAGAALVTMVLVINRPEAQQRTTSPPTLYVQTLIAQPETLRFSIHAQGTVGPRVETTLVSEVSGQVVDRAPSFVAGGFFRAGDVLLEIDPRNYRAQVARAQAMVAQSRTQIARELVIAGLPANDWERLRSLDLDDEEARNLALRKPGLAQALAELASANAQLEQARGDLERTRIRAPYDGMVRSRRADIGQFLNQGTPIAETFAVDRAEVRLPLRQNDLPFIDLPPAGVGVAPGAAPRVTLTADLGQQHHSWSGALVRTEGVFDARSQVLYGIVEVDDPYGVDHAIDQPLRVGTFVAAEIEGRMAENVIRLPRHTLRPGNRLWVVDDQERIQPRQVTLLRADEQWIYVSGGLEAGARVSITPVENPVAGMPVRIIDSTGDATGDAGGGRLAPRVAEAGQ